MKCISYQTFIATCWALLLVVVAHRMSLAQKLGRWHSRGGRRPLTAIVSFAAILFLPLIVKLGERRITSRYWRSLVSTSGISCPWLFVYGDADALVSSHHVECAIQLRRRNGGHVESLCLEGSPHVQHLRTHPNKYKSVVKSFVVKHLLAR